jgi:MsuE subfamily FMN reductase
MGLRVLAINGSLTPPPSRTRALIDAALTGATAHDPAVETAVLELREFDLEFCDGRRPDQYNADTRKALAMIAEADAYFVATPVYRASYTGALKNLFDLVPNDPDRNDPLRGKVVGLLASGGSDHHYLLLEHQLRPLFGFFGAHTASRAVYAAPADFDGAKQPEGKIVAELHALGKEVVQLTQLIRQAGGMQPEHLRIRRT